ncbi:MAG: hypothetical protein KatS3mg009_1076 [Acidimicrobiia bacterium]|nr:MAG: hypothetical protein KatS3mg009_1076 [Acidimicrobiia bacterium]
MEAGGHELRDALDEFAIRRLHDAYGDVVHRRAWSELAGLFLPDAVVTVDRRDAAPLELTGPGAVGRFVGDAIARYAHFGFTVLTAHVSPRAGGDPDRATARVHINEVRVDHEGRFSTAYGVYRDEYRRAGGRWWYARRHYASLARGTPGERFDVFPHPDA